MKQHIFNSIVLFSLFVLSALTCTAQTLEVYFIYDLKSQLQINQETRYTLINGYNEGKGSSLKMQNGGTTSILAYEKNNFLKISTSNDGFFSIKRWTVGQETLFGMSWWVCGKQCDGIIKIVNSDPLRQSIAFPTISLQDFFDIDSLQKDQLTPDEFYNKFEAEFIHYEFTPSDTIWVINNTEEFLDELRQKQYKKYWAGNALPVILTNGTFIKGPITRKEK